MDANSAFDTDISPRHTQTPTPPRQPNPYVGKHTPPPPPPPNALKRKTPPAAAASPPPVYAVLAADDDEEDRKPLVLPPGAALPPGGEYASGQVICSACGTGVSFRDDNPKDKFTLKHWEAHRISCAPQRPQQQQPEHQHQHQQPQHLQSQPQHPQPEGNPQHRHPHTQHQHAQLHHQHVPYLDPHAHAFGPPPTKRRRAKRTEEERIAYLRGDPHVAKFEAYRVLCASCDKWIRLRPNSTYCSIPWDAHRKSCLAKKANARALYGSSASGISALHSQRIADGHPNPNPHIRITPNPNANAAAATFTNDSNVRKFDAERVLCGVCDKWIALPTDDPTGAGAMHVWTQHRDACVNTVSALKNVVLYGSSTTSTSTSTSTSTMQQQRDAEEQDKEGEERKPLVVVGSPPTPRPTSAPGPAPRAFAPAPPSTPASHHQQHPPPPPPPHPLTHPPGPTHLPHPDAPHILLDLSPANYAAPHESRRRNAEQRAATLRADILIRDVEPNRVFCTLCAKWVQLRQDSSYCAYPWLQHRGKCLARYQRRAQKAHDIAANSNGFKAKRPRISTGTANGHASPESEDGSSARRTLLPSPPHHGHPSTSPVVMQHPPRAHAAVRPLGTWPPPPSAAAVARERDAEADADGEGDADAEGDVDADGDSYMEEEGYANGTASAAAAILRRAVPASLADLDSEGGRRTFIHASVAYLFRATYEPAHDRLSVSALLAYLNAAMPPDKHEDFDTAEVARAAAALAAAGRCASVSEGGRRTHFALEGDMLRVLS